MLVAKSGKGAIASILCLIILIANCSGDPRQEIVGRWTSQQTALLTLHFYNDGAASLSSIGYFKLRWKIEDKNLVRIEALDRNIYFNFRMSTDAKGRFGI